MVTEFEAITVTQHQGRGFKALCLVRQPPMGPVMLIYNIARKLVYIRGKGGGLLRLMVRLPLGQRLGGSEVRHTVGALSGFKLVKLC